MQILDRDLRLLRLIAAFKQLTAKQIDTIEFHDNASRDVHRRVLRRLTQDKYLARIERRLVGGLKGGSGQYAYQLGAEGWRIFNRGKYRPMMAINHHSLAIGDSYVQLIEAGRAGKFTISQLVTEPDTHQVIAGAEIRPDLFIELQRGQGSMHIWLEIDMGTERPKQIKDKLARYWHAYQHSDESDMPSFPRVVFLVPDDVRLADIRRAIDSGSDEARGLFSVYKLDGFVEHLV